MIRPPVFMVVMVLGKMALAADPPAPDSYGPWILGHSIHTITDASRDDRSLEVRVWYPADRESISGGSSYYLSMDIGIARIGRESRIAWDDLPLSADGPFPLVVFSHGATSLNLQSLDLVETLASHGFVVAAPNHTGDTTHDLMDGTLIPQEEMFILRPGDVSFVIDRLLSGDLLAGAVDPSRIGVCGHSFGAFTSLVMASGFPAPTQIDPDPRVLAFMPVSVSGSDAIDDQRLSTITRPFLFLGGTADSMTPIDPYTTRPWELLSSAERYRVDIRGATHTHFANVCEVGDGLIAAGLDQSTWPAIGAEQLLDHYEKTCGPEAFPIEEAQRIQNKYAVSFFRRHLADDKNYASFLTARHAEKNEPDLIFFTTVEESGGDTGCGMGIEPALLLLWLGIRFEKRRYKDKLRKHRI